jgi:hypothetical protein
MRRHVIIAGTGRAGTSFLMELLHELGIDIGRDRLIYRTEARAGLEYDLGRDDAPYVVKNPKLSTKLSGLLARGDIAIDHAILPVRDIRHAAQSRINMEAAAKMPLWRWIRWRLRKKSTASGGLWGVRWPWQQERKLRYVLSEFVVTLAAYDIPHTLLHFPRLVEDEEYLFSKLRGPFPAIDRDEFRKAFGRLADRDKVTVR